MVLCTGCSNGQAASYICNSERAETVQLSHLLLAEKFIVQEGLDSMYRICVLLHLRVKLLHAVACAGICLGLDVMYDCQHDMIHPGLCINSSALYIIMLKLLSSRTSCGALCRESMPAERIHTMFLSLGLRHMVVVDGVFRVVGLITRKELDYAAGQGAWRRNRRASSPRRYSLHHDCNACQDQGCCWW